MKNDNPALIILSPGFPENEADSTCLPPQQLLVRSLNRIFPSLPIIIISFQYPFAVGEYTWFGNRVLALGGRNRHKIFRLRTWWRARQALYRIQKQTSIRGIFSFWCTECSLVGHHFGERNHIPQFTWILGQDARSSNRFVRWIKPKPNELVAMSQFLSDEFFRNHGIGPAHIIPNGLDPSMYPKQPAARDIDVLGAGSLIPLKQFDQFISICGRLLEQFPEARMLLCGKGPEEALLSKMIADGHWVRSISLAGECAHPALLETMSRARIFLHTSNYEGFSTVCLEALGAGAHVISYCDPGFGEWDHWHIARDEAHMLSIARQLLADPDTSYEPALPYRMDDNAVNLMALFDYPETTT